MDKDFVYHEDEHVRIVYIPLADEYAFRVNSTLSGERHFSLDQRVLEEFSSHDLNHLSETLGIMNLSNGLSRTDIIRVYDAILETMKKYEEEFKEFKKKESL